MIHVESITQHYAAKPVLRGLSLHVKQGELVALMGPNGTGKSTLLKVVAGVLSPQKGQVKIDGLVRRSSVDAENAIRRRTVYLSDHPWLPMGRTGREFLVDVGKLYVNDIERVMEHAERLFRLFNLEGQADARIGSYSNGQQKKLAVASALVADADVLILDEPFTGGLDPAAVVVLKRLLRRLAERVDRTVLMATQIADIARDLAHRIALIRDEAIGMLDTPEAIIASQPGTGSLEDAVERFLNPHALADLEQYFEEENK